MTPFTREDLSQALARPVGSFAITRQFDGRGAFVARIEVIFDEQSDPEPLALVAKACMGTACAAEGIPEIAFFRDLAPRVPDLAIPAMLGWKIDHDETTSLLLTEDLSETHRSPTAIEAPDILGVLVDEIARLHATFWDHSALASDSFAMPRANETRMPQAYPAAVVRANAGILPAIAASFRVRFRNALSIEEDRLVSRLVASWPGMMEARTAQGNLTLIHGDLHLLGNVLTSVGDGEDRIRIIDWADCKPGLGTHDIAYSTIAIQTLDRKHGDLAMLQRYHRQLCELGVSTFSWEQCLWDYRFALLTNLLQCMLQESLTWFRTTAAIITEVGADSLLDETSDPPRML
ncbi:MAG TPA: phosphotransferase [Thermomicrobiales bacterium]|nr:phosphotransferase [Thermomicrobiales bacterium]